MKTCSGTERMFWFDCGVDDKNSMKQSLAKPSTIHILIPIPMPRQHDFDVSRLERYCKNILLACLTKVRR
jgi:hypothetical protein